MAVCVAAVRPPSHYIINRLSMEDSPCHVHQCVVQVAPAVYPWIRYGFRTVRHGSHTCSSMSLLALSCTANCANHSTRAVPTAVAPPRPPTPFFILDITVVTRTCHPHVLVCFGKEVAATTASVPCPTRLGTSAAPRSFLTAAARLWAPQAMDQGLY